MYKDKIVLTSGGGNVSFEQVTHRYSLILSVGRLFYIKPYALKR